MWKAELRWQPLMLNLVRVPLDTSLLAHWARSRGWVKRGGHYTTFDEGRALHHLIAEAFGPGVFSAFRLLVASRKAVGNLYAYSSWDAEALRTAAAAHAPPEHLAVLPPERIESKPMPSSWRTGQQLGFDLRTRPVRRLRRELAGRFREGAEVDAFLVHALRHSPDDPDAAAHERESVYLEWLAERLSPAATLVREHSRLARFRRVRVARTGKGPEGPDATIHGDLIVADPTKFATLLASGAGRHRAYGYGMLLLRPPNQRPLVR